MTKSTLASEGGIDNLVNSPADQTDFTDDKYHLAPEIVASAAKELNININNVNPEDYEDSNNTTNASQDDVLVKAQKEKRGTGKGQKSKKVISNAVVQVENKSSSYIFVRESANKMFESIIAFLIINNILNKHQLIFFSDGARSIHEKIENMFPFTKYKIILDWFHLVKKFKEFCSMAFKGREIRNEFLRLIFPMLWFGNVNKQLTR